MHQIRVYTRPGCGWCGAVKSLLRKHSYMYCEVRIDDDDAAMRFLAQQLAFSVPQVFVGDRRVGGYEATVEAIISGEFERLLDEERAEAPLVEQHAS
jgi:glutaredoxin 3